MITESFFPGSRITSIFNFGYVSLNIMHLRAEDAGSYTVRAVNRLGEAISSATLRVFGESSVSPFERMSNILRFDRPIFTFYLTFAQREPA